MHEGLVGHLSPPGKLANVCKQRRVHAEGYCDLGCSTDWWASNPPHRTKLLVRQLRNVRKVASVVEGSAGLDSSLHRALRLKAAETETSISELVNTAVQRSLAEDALDLAAFDERAREPVVAFEAVLKDLRRRGKL